jgi:phenylacetic acid degradation protein paaN
MSLFDTHRELLDAAIKALATRGHWSPFPEIPSPKVYGEQAQAEGQAAVAARVGTDYPLQQPGERARIATEQSPYGVRLGIQYPDCAPEALLEAAEGAEPGWQALGPAGRTGVLLEALMRIHRRSHEIARAVMLTTGQGEMMAFQAGGPHAQDRALEAIACAWRAMAEVPAESVWEKPQGKNPPLVMHKNFEIVGRGVALVIGCATFPTWNTYPGLFAALATGNPVIVKPHPNAVLPAAITVSVLRDVLAEQGLDPNVVTLAVSATQEQARALSTDARVTSIDFTGGNAFGHWLQNNARQARLYAEMAGVNTVVIESTDDYAGMLRNLAFSLCLYSGQMCTTPQNLLVPQQGILTNEGLKSFEQFGHDLAAAIDTLLADNKVATSVLGAIGSVATLERLEAAHRSGHVVSASRCIEHPLFGDAHVRTPLLLAVEHGDRSAYEQECFGPVSYLVATESARQAATIAESVIRSRGALTLSVYSNDQAFVDSLVAVSRRARVALSINLTKGVFVNQSAAFSDFHATGGNPAANASYTSTAFVADRFVVVQRREHVRA